MTEREVWVIFSDDKPVSVSEKSPTLVADYRVSARRYIPAESAKAEAQPAGTGWVSVEERLPARDVDVLVLGRSGGYHVCHMTIDGRIAGWYPGGWGVGHTTHWQPLPPPPERDR